MKVMLKFALILGALLALMVLFPMFAFSYDNLTEAPEGIGEFLAWAFANAKPAFGAGAASATAFVCTVLLGISKFTPLKPVFDKLGNFKFIIPMILGAVAELALNFPTPFSVKALVIMLYTGAMGTGTAAIAFHHIADKFIKKKEPVA